MSVDDKAKTSNATMKDKSKTAVYSKEYFESILSILSHAPASDISCDRQNSETFRGSHFAARLPELVTWVEVDAETEFALKDNKAGVKASMDDKSVEELDMLILASTSSSFGLSLIGIAMIVASGLDCGKRSQVLGLHLPCELSRYAYFSEHLIRLCLPLLVVLLKCPATAHHEGLILFGQLGNDL
jgi:hypothetical protein